MGAGSGWSKAKLRMVKRGLKQPFPQEPPPSCRQPTSRGCHIPTKSWLPCLHRGGWLSPQQNDFSLRFGPLTFLLCEFHLRSPGSEDITATRPSRITVTVILPQVEDITASHEAALLEMENNHTVAIAILQDDHDHKVQGSYHPRCVWPAGWAMGAQPPAADTRSTSRSLVPLAFLPSFCSWRVLWLLAVERKDAKPGSR